MECTVMHDTLGFKIIQTGKSLSKKINGDFLNLNTEITLEQMGVLYYISTKGSKEIIQQDVAEMMNKTKSAVLRSIDILEEKNYLVRIKKNNDRRMNIIKLTEKGHYTLEKVQELFLKMEATLNNELTKQEEKECITVLDKIKVRCR